MIDFITVIATAKHKILLLFLLLNPLQIPHCRVVGGEAGEWYNNDGDGTTMI
jgi:hypothetical protein